MIDRDDDDEQANVIGNDRAGDVDRRSARDFDDGDDVCVDRNDRLDGDDDGDDDRLSVNEIGNDRGKI